MSDEIDEGAETAVVKPDAQQVFRRALILSCVAARSFIEAKEQRQEREQTRCEVLAWFNARGLQTDAEPGELALLHAPVGTLVGQQVVDAGWRCEDVLVLAWALGLAEIGPFYVQIPDPREVVGLVGYMND